jgi:hypothetical protein
MAITPSSTPTTAAGPEPELDREAAATRTCRQVTPRTSARFQPALWAVFLKGATHTKLATGANPIARKPEKYLTAPGSRFSAHL